MTVQAVSSSPGIAGGAEKRTTFHGTDPDKAAETAISASTSTKCQAMNVPYRGFGRAWGVGASFLIMVILAAVLYVAFRRNDWL
jgi:hypothetical protein